jgi:cytochrome c-type biogenesis protein
VDHFINSAGAYIHTNPWLAVVAVFLGGLLTASNPCVLAMVPLMISMVAGRKEDGPGTLRAFSLSLVFVLGLAVMFTCMGMIAALAGKMYGDVSSYWNWVVAAVCLLMGLHMIGILKISIPVPAIARPKAGGLVGAFVLGLLFGQVSAPCAAPILVVLLTYLAGSGASIAYGGLLLLVYALGHSVFILLAGTFMGAARTMIENKNMVRAMAVLRQAAGVAIVLVGTYFACRGLQ